MDNFVSATFQKMYRSRNKDEFLEYANTLKKYAIENNSLYVAYRIAILCADKRIRCPELEDIIVESGNSYFILNFAINAYDANVRRLQDAIIKTKNISDIAKFGCFVRGSDRKVIEELVANANSARGAYYYLRFSAACDVNKLKPVILKSKRPRYLYELALKLTDKAEIKMIQDLIIKSRSPLYMRLFAQNVPGADILRIEDAVIATKDIDAIRKWAEVIKTDNAMNILLLA